MAEIVRTDDVLHGYPRIEGTRVGVLQVHERVVENDVDPLRVAREYDVDPADVHRALAYYYDNAGEMRELREKRERTIADHREKSGPRSGERPRTASRD